MRAVVTWILDGTVVMDEITAEHITCKIHKSGRGYVTADSNATIYRRVESIKLFRTERVAS